MASLEMDADAVFATLCICATVVAVSCNATLIAERWGGAEYQVRKACVYKTGNPDCRPSKQAEKPTP